MGHIVTSCSLLAAIIVAALASSAAPTEVPWRTATHAGYTLYYTAGDSAVAPRAAAAVDRGMTRVTRFFGGRFARPIAVRLLPDRAALDRLWQEAWHAPDFHSECWMVASGTAQELDVLSPNAWKTEACEHDPANAAHMDRLIAHELTHVYQGQHSPRPELDGMDDLGWFVEGVAVVASGQLDEEPLAPAKDAVAAHAAPDSLAHAWSGKYRYGVSGSLVRFVDRRVGRRTLARMLADTTQSQLLAHVGLAEGELLARWRESVAR
jgi:hypothetical protein